MDLVRRIYLYAMSAVAIGVLAYGLVALLTVVLHAIGLGGGVFLGGDADSDRRALSLAISLIGVSLPVWAIHWYLVERGLSGSGPPAERERTSALRAFYLAAIMAILLLVAAAAGATLIRFVIERLVPDLDSSYADPAAALATIVVAAAGWALHAWTRLRDVARGELRGAAAWWPRLYRYGVAFVGLSFFVNGLGTLAGLLIDVVAGAGDVVSLDPFGNPNAYGFRFSQLAPDLLIGLAAWASHAWASNRVAIGSGWHAASERASRLRLAYWPLIIGVAAISVVARAAEGLAPLFIKLLGGELAGIANPNRALAVALAGSAAAVAPWLVAWWLHRRWARTDATASGEPGRAGFLDWLERHVAGAVGLAFGAVALGWIVGLAIDAALGGNRTTGDGWRLELGRYLALALLGVPLWIWNWSSLVAHRAAHPMDAGSPLRRTYLLLIVGVAILSTLGSLAVVLFRLVSTLLGTDLGGNGVSELSTPLGALLVAIAVVAYHGLQLRDDQAVRVAVAPTTTDLTPAEPHDAAALPATPVIATVARRSLVLTAPADADIESTLAALRAALPEGQVLDEA